VLGIDNRYPNFVGGFASFSRLERVTGGATNCTATDPPSGIDPPEMRTIEPALSSSVKSTPDR
jgi:hypothetical protein